MIDAMSDEKQIAKTSNNLPQLAQSQQPIQANLNQYGNDSTQIAYVQHYDGTVNNTVVILPGGSQYGALSAIQGLTFNYDCFNVY